jgi:hypothetical protein
MPRNICGRFADSAYFLVQNVKCHLTGSTISLGVTHRDIVLAVLSLMFDSRTTSDMTAAISRLETTQRAFDPQFDRTRP